MVPPRQRRMSVGLAVVVRILAMLASLGELVVVDGKALGKDKGGELKCPGHVVNLRRLASEMFHFGYGSYLEHAFPLDELDPIHCTGRGVDPDSTNININDVLGNYSLTLVDSLDSVAIMGKPSDFDNAVRLVIQHVSFDQDSTVQVFELTIRALGGLLSAHLIACGQSPLQNMRLDWYDDELLWLARDLGVRLLPAFDESPTGIPHPRVNLRDGVPEGARTDTCTAGAGSLLLEFGLLSRLTGDSTFEYVARRAVHAIWSRRHRQTNLLGSRIDAVSGKWMDKSTGVGAGVDSFFEYLFKAYVLFGERELYDMYISAMQAVGKTMWVGAPPVFANVNMDSGNVSNHWSDALQAYMPGLLACSGIVDLDIAISHHASYYALWARFHAMPERFNWQAKAAEVKFYPLRPELAESTYHLYRVTKDPFYLEVGRQILCDIERFMKVECGYATMHSVATLELEDRMESFFLSETVKYLYLLFDNEHALHQPGAEHLFTTQGHLITLTPAIRSGADFDTAVAVESFGRGRNGSTAVPKCSRRNPMGIFFHPVRRFGAIANAAGLSKYAPYPSDPTEVVGVELFPRQAADKAGRMLHTDTDDAESGHAWPGIGPSRRDDRPIMRTALKSKG